MTSFSLAVSQRDADMDMKTFITKWDLLKTAIALASSWSQITEDTLRNAWKRLLRSTPSTETAEQQHIEETGQQTGETGPVIYVFNFNECNLTIAVVNISLSVKIILIINNVISFRN